MSAGRLPRMTVTPTSADEVDLSSFELWAAPEEVREAAFALLRRERPVARFEEYPYGDFPAGPGYWALTRFDDIRHVSRHPQTFISGKGINIGDLPQEISEFFGSMIAMDDPRHARIRGIVNRAFTPKTVNDLGDTVRSVARQVLARIAERGECDVVHDVAAAVPLQIICDMMGIPAEDYETIYHHTNTILGVGDPEFVNSMEDLINAGGALFQYAFALAEERRQRPRDDLTTRLVSAESLGEGEEPMTAQEYGSFFILLVVAGNETTRNAISWALKLFTDHPDQRQLLLQDFEARIPGAVEEIVRWSTPVIHFRRTATEDCTIAGRDIAAGDKVVLFYNSGNRDESKWDDPHRFDILRSPNDHLGFGAGGPHFCLGAHLARREIRVVLEELFRTFPDFEVTGEPERLLSAFIHGIKRMPARFTPAAV